MHEFELQRMLLEVNVLAGVYELCQQVHSIVFVACILCASTFLRLGDMAVIIHTKIDAFMKLTFQGIGQTINKIQK